MKIFISQPISYKKKEDLLKEESKIVSFLETMFIDEDIEWIHYLYKNDCSALESLGKSLIEMSKADVVVFATDYDADRECRMQFIAAHDYGIDIIEMDDYWRGEQ